MSPRPLSKEDLIQELLKIKDLFKAIKTTKFLEWLTLGKGIGYFEEFRLFEKELFNILNNNSSHNTLYKFAIADFIQNDISTLLDLFDTIPELFDFLALELGNKDSILKKIHNAFGAFNEIANPRIRHSAAHIMNILGTPFLTDEKTSVANKMANIIDLLAPAHRTTAETSLILERFEAKLEYLNYKHDFDSFKNKLETVLTECNANQAYKETMYGKKYLECKHIEDQAMCIGFRKGNTNLLFQFFKQYPTVFEFFKHEFNQNYNKLMSICDIYCTCNHLVKKTHLDNKEAKKTAPSDYTVELVSPDGTSLKLTGNEYEMSISGRIYGNEGIYSPIVPIETLKEMALNYRKALKSIKEPFWNLSAAEPKENSAPLSKTMTPQEESNEKISYEIIDGVRYHF